MLSSQGGHVLPTSITFGSFLIMNYLQVPQKQTNGFLCFTVSLTRSGLN
ncbi:unnamed protein product [Musa hybrid cultivar]